jgi:hypothetical protein
MIASQASQGIIGRMFQVLNSPLITMILSGAIVIAIAGIYLWMQIKPVKKILYFSEEEHNGIEYTVKRTTPAHLYTRKKGGDQYRFIRFRDAFTFQLGFRAVTRWLAKKGTAYCKKLESGEVGNFTLYKVMQAVWGDDVIDALVDEQKQKLIDSNVLITVKLEEGLTPKGANGEDYKTMGELYIKNESDAEMARVFGENVRKEMNREDWVRSGALVGCGVALCYIAQAMGLIGGVAT